MIKTKAMNAPTTSPDRGSPGRPALPLDRILAAALRIVDDEGADALTMRRLAGVLGAGTATLYRHFDGRAGLIAHVVDRLFEEMLAELDTTTPKDWSEAYRSLALRIFDVLGRHRGAALLLLESMPSGPNAMSLRERCLATLLANGFQPELAALAYATFARFVLGFAIQVAARREATGQPDGVDFGKLDMSAFPATATVGKALPVALETEFAFALSLMLDSLDRRQREDRTIDARN